MLATFELVGSAGVAVLAITVPLVAIGIVLVPDRRGGRSRRRTRRTLSRTPTTENRQPTTEICSRARSMRSSAATPARMA
jgi:hypothetical protein